MYLITNVCGCDGIQHSVSTEGKLLKLTNIVPVIKEKMYPKPGNNVDQIVTVSDEGPYSQLHR